MVGYAAELVIRAGHFGSVPLAANPPYKQKLNKPGRP
jgi:hypothetical protein